MGHRATYAGLFAAALAAATVLPVQSEVVLIPLLLAQHYPAWLLVLAASLGNTLGSPVNWALGRLLARFEHQRWFPVRGARPSPGPRPGTTATAAGRCC